MEAVFRARMEEVCANAHTLAADAADQDALLVWLHAVMRHLMSAQGMLSALVVRGLRQSDPDANLMWGLTMLTRAVDGLLENAKAEGQIRPDLTAQDIVDLVYGICLAVDARRGTTPTPDALADHLLTLTLEGVRGS